MNKKSICKLIINNKILKDFFGNVKKISLLNQSENIVYLIIGEKNSGVAKIGYRGWNKFEYKNYLKLYSRGYPVPRPIHYFPLQGEILKGWSFGDLEREIGVLICEYIEGDKITSRIDQDQLIKSILLLKKIHLDVSLYERPIENYKKIEIERGKSYLPELNHELREKIAVQLDKYRDIPIELTFIHGGARIEHFIYNLNGIYIVDLESSSMGDPLKDVAYFFIDLLINGLYSREFLDVYFEKNLSLNLKERLNFFILRQLLLKYKFERLKEQKEKILFYLKTNNLVKILGVN